MALTSNNCHSDMDSIIIQTSAGTTADANLLTDTTGSVYTIVLDNRSGSSANYIKLYDAKSATHGTTDPVFCAEVAASGICTIVCASGIVLGTALSVAASAAAGTGSGGAGPGGTFKYTIYGS